jgi:hypothetical protein
MVEETVVKKLIELKNKLKDEGPLNLFALVQRDERDNWDIVISSSTFLNKEKEFLSSFVKLLQENLTNKELENILRVALLKPDDIFVQNINSSINITEGSMTIENSTFNNMLIKKMYLLYSSKI